MIYGTINDQQNGFMVIPRVICKEYFAINKISTKKKEENVQATVNEFPLEGGVLLRNFIEKK